MQTEKKTFTKAEVEVIRFEKADIITTSVGNNPPQFNPGDNEMPVFVP